MAILETIISLLMAVEQPKIYVQSTNKVNTVATYEIDTDNDRSVDAKVNVRFDNEGKPLFVNIYGADRHGKAKENSYVFNGKNLYDGNGDVVKDLGILSTTDIAVHMKADAEQRNRPALERIPSQNMPEFYFKKVENSSIDQRVGACREFMDQYKKDIASNPDRESLWKPYIALLGLNNPGMCRAMGIKP